MTLKFKHSVGAFVLLAAMSCTLNAQVLSKQWAATLPIFDAHLHYNVEAFGDGAANAPYPMDAVFELFRKNKVTAIIANSRPNSGSVALWERQKSVDQGVTVVPFIRLYRDRSDYQTWHNNPEIWAMVQTEYAKGFFRGIGEFHLYNSEHAKGDTAVKVMKFAQEKNLVILAHCDDVAIELLLNHAPKAKVIWAHTGFSTPSQRVEALLRKFPGLLGELSYRSGLNSSTGLSNEWRALFTRYPERFLLGSDTWVNSRWDQYGATLQDYRSWLADLPEPVAKAIAWKNGYSLFGLPTPK